MNGKIQAKNLHKGDIVKVDGVLGYTLGYEATLYTAAMYAVLDLLTNRVLATVSGPRTEMVTLVNPEIISAEEIIIDGTTYRLPKSHPARRRIVEREIETDKIMRKMNLR